MLFTIGGYAIKVSRKSGSAIVKSDRTYDSRRIEGAFAVGNQETRNNLTVGRIF
jgi:hypothetical protein